MRREWPKPLAEMFEPDRTAVVTRGLQALLEEESKYPESLPAVVQVLEGLRTLTVRRFDRMIADGRAYAEKLEEWLASMPAREEEFKRSLEEPYEATGVHSSADVQGIADRLLARLREAPDDDARLEVLAPIFDAYCKLCGSDRGRDCQCWNDE